jgi:hypothetical protein
MKRFTGFFVMGIAVVVLAGCAKQPSTADLMRAQALEVQAQVDMKNQLAKDWDRGSKLVRSGEKLVKRGEKQIKTAEKDLKDGRARVEQGERDIIEGRKLMQESERQFHDNFPGINLY